LVPDSTVALPPRDPAIQHRSANAPGRVGSSRVGGSHRGGLLVHGPQDPTSQVGVLRHPDEPGRRLLAVPGANAHQQRATGLRVRND